WDRLARDLAPATLERVRQAVVPLADVPRWAEAILAGEVRGRVVVALGD
ncbi:MAG: oxidoreductase, partial [Chloroflexi bacterium CFX6]|nr:oxidoreductase [Chloroflexi bacterium CFX6]